MDQKQIVSYLLKNREKLMAYIWPIVRDLQVAEDVYQNVAILAMERHEQIHDDQHLRRWLRKASRLKSLEAIRQNKRKPLALSNETLDLLDQHWEAYDQVDTSDLVDALRNCIGRLSSYARQLIKLRYGEGMACSEVADAVNRNIHAVYKALSRSHDQLRKCMQDKGKVPFHAPQTESNTNDVSGHWGADA